MECLGSSEFWADILGFFRIKNLLLLFESGQKSIHQTVFIMFDQPIDCIGVVLSFRMVDWGRILKRNSDSLCSTPFSYSVNMPDRFERLASECVCYFQLLRLSIRILHTRTALNLLLSILVRSTLKNKASNQIQID